MGETGAAAHWHGRGWAIEVGTTDLFVTVGTSRRSISGEDIGRLAVRRSFFRWSLFDGDVRIARLHGFSRAEARRLEVCMSRLVVAPEVSAACAWHQRLTDLVARAVADQRWITTETVDDLLSTRPRVDLVDRVRKLGLLQAHTTSELLAMAALGDDLEAGIAAANDRIVRAELSTRRRFFDTIEKSPLTDEQARAVITFDNRVQVLAAAGSGKTSVMVARAAYAVSRGLVSPDRILLLAFNKGAAKELQERIESRFALAGIDATGVKASTFHAFGLDLIGQATGRKPRPAPWLEGSGDVRMITEIVDELRTSSKTFRYNWDLYRLLFGPAPIDPTENEPDSFDKNTAVTGYETFGGHTVRSHGERMIANFLHLNGVNFAYERPYSVDVATPRHSQYHPDFYYPDIDVWHEHWAVGRDGQPVASFDGYAEEMEWKRGLHAEHGTRLIESTWAGVLWGSGLQDLEYELAGLGVTRAWPAVGPHHDVQVSAGDLRRSP